MFGQDRNQLRNFFHSTWQKRCAGDSLEGLELLVAQIIEQHPEYHVIINNRDKLDHDYTPEDGQTNPFLHMGMHISLGEQLASDRPPGIRILHQKITLKTGNAHEAEHQMMDCLGLVLWEAQRSGKMPDESAYLECMNKLSG